MWFFYEERDPYKADHDYYEMKREITIARSEALFAAVQEGAVCLEDVMVFPVGWHDLALIHQFKANSLSHFECRAIR